MRPDYDMYPLESRSHWKAICLVVLLVLLICSVGLNVYFYAERTALQEKEAAAAEQTKKLENEILSLKHKLGAAEERADYFNEENSAYEEKMDFYDEHVVFVEDDGTMLYHTYDCYRFDKDNFFAFNVEYAEDQGYSPCEKCSSLDAKFTDEYLDLREERLNPFK